MYPSHCIDIHSHTNENVRKTDQCLSLFQTDIMQNLTSHIVIFAVCCIGLTISGDLWQGNRPHPDKNLLSLITRATAARDNALMMPPSGYQGRLPSYYDRTLSKREPLWIWMPAQGYVPVPRTSNINTSDGSGSSVIRYG